MNIKNRFSKCQNPSNFICLYNLNKSLSVDEISEKLEVLKDQIFIYKSKHFIKFENEQLSDELGKKMNSKVYFGRKLKWDFMKDNFVMVEDVELTKNIKVPGFSIFVDYVKESSDEWILNSLDCIKPPEENCSLKIRREKNLRNNLHFSHSEFGGEVRLFVLNSGCVMRLQNSLKSNIYKLVYLPENAMVTITGEARYGWIISIEPQKFDKVNGKIITRKHHKLLIFSGLFLREKSIPCSCEFHSVCDTFQSKKSIKKMESILSNLSSFEIEKRFVFDVYEEIATHWNETRYKAWPAVVDFMENQIQPGSIVADVGCGNGKNMLFLNRKLESKRVSIIGCDICLNLLKICVEKKNKLQVFHCDCRHLPFASESVDYAMSIAVLHHIVTEEDRIQSLEELSRIVKVGGEVFVSVWSLEQHQKGSKEGIKRKFLNTPDQLVSWKLQEKFGQGNKKKKNQEESEGEENENENENENEKNCNGKRDRYCHLYHKGELEKLWGLLKKSEVKVLQSTYDYGNWFVRVKRMK